MKQTLLSTIALVGLSVASQAQMFNPSASALPGGTMNQAYSGQIINFTVPSTSSVDGGTVASAVVAAFPQASLLTGLLSGQTFPMNVQSTTITVAGLPAGMTATCDASPCTYVAGASGTITLGGTPTASGQFTIDLNTSTSGEADLSAFAGQLSGFGIPSTFAIPQPVPGALDEDGYTLFVNNPNGIAEQNKIFSLGFYPNPTEGQSVLDLNTSLSGMATVEVYAITGSLVKTSTHAVRTGANRLALDLSGLRAGIYMVKADINGHQALIRIQKK
jgi:hypothetical protein